MTRTALAILLAGSAAAQPDMLVTIEDFNGDGSWSITAEFLTVPPSPIVQLWADASFQLSGDGSPITFTGYNTAYDTALGDAEITNGPTASFTGAGSLSPFFGTPDPSNPLWVGDFDYEGALEDLRLELVGQNSALFDLPPFGDVRLYNSLDPLFGLTHDVRVVPVPATLAVAPLAMLAALRRR